MVGIYRLIALSAPQWLFQLRDRNYLCFSPDPEDFGVGTCRL